MAVEKSFTVLVRQNTKELLNKARAKLIRHDSNVKATDNNTISAALKVFLYGKSNYTTNNTNPNEFANSGTNTNENGGS